MGRSPRRLDSYARLVLVPAALLAGACSGGTGPDDDPEGPAGRIVFTSTRLTGDRDLFVMDADGRNAQAILSGGGDHNHPVVSPDGTRIAFYANGFADGMGSADFEIFVINLDGTGLIQVTNNSDFHEYHPAWSPDGSFLVAVREPVGSGPHEIIVLVPEAGGAMAIIPGAIGVAPSWSPDGQRIAYDWANKIHVMDWTGANDAVLYETTGSAGEAAWSPDGTQLVFSHFSGDVMIMDADGSNVRPITGPSAGGEDHPAWSPDGEYLAYTAFRDGNQEIAIRKSDGTGEVVLTRLGAEDQHPSWVPAP